MEPRQDHCALLPLRPLIAAQLRRCHHHRELIGCQAAVDQYQEDQLDDQQEDGGVV